MAFDFPNAPTLGQTYPQPPVAGQPVYTWDGQKWGIIGSLPAQTQTASTTALIPGGNVASTNVQAGVAELDSEKVAKAGDVMTGTLTINAPKSADALRFHDTTSNTNTTVRPGTTGGGIELVNNAYSAVTASIDDAGNILGMNNVVQAIGNKINTPGIYYDAPNGNIGVRGSGGVFLQNAAGGSYAIFTGSGSTLYGRSEVTGGLLTYSNINIADGGPSSVELRAAAGQACITFHNPAAFACQFGMANGHFYKGGYSFGAQTFQFWTSQDFAAPNLAPYVSNGRLAFVADVGIPYNSQMWEPYNGAVITGCYSITVSYYVIQQFRFRYMQLLTTGWFTCGYA